MALLIPYARSQGQERNFTGRPPGTGYGQLLTASATPHTLGTKVVIVASTLYDSNWVSIVFNDSFTSGANSDTLSNLYLGGAGVEVVLIPNMMAGWCRNIDARGRRYRFPVHIPRGSRITMDLQGVVISQTSRVTLELFQDGGWRGSGVEALGINVGTSRGTAVTGGTTSDGTFTTIGTSGRHYRYVLAHMMGNVDVTMTTGIQALDVGTGSALIPELAEFWCSNNNNEAQQPGMESSEGRWVDIPSGTALQARTQNDGSDTEAKSVAIYGVY